MCKTTHMNKSWTTGMLQTKLHKCYTSWFLLHEHSSWHSMWWNEYFVWYHWTPLKWLAAAVLGLLEMVALQRSDVCMISPWTSGDRAVMRNGIWIHVAGHRALGQVVLEQRLWGWLGYWSSNKQTTKTKTKLKKERGDSSTNEPVLHNVQNWRHQLSQKP